MLMTVHPTTEQPASPFAKRHLGLTDHDVEQMLAAVGASNLAVLIDETIPSDIRQAVPLGIGAGVSETQALEHLKQIAKQNALWTSLIGQGYHDTILPPVIQRNILENPAWYTAYTPYQPEISQGRLEAILNFQTMISDLTGLPVANASLLDEATAAAEAMAMAHRVSSNPGHVFFVDLHCHPQTIAVLKTRAEPLGWTLVIGDPNKDLDADAVFGALLQYPDTRGAINSGIAAIIASLKSSGAIAIVCADPLALCLLTPPGELGADIAIGSTQRFGVPMGYGGPHAAYMACIDSYKRVLPGRLVGVSRDARGKQAFRLTLQTREQHIRREKATSNICTAQVLLAVIASMYGVYHGREGLRAIAEGVHRHTSVLAEGLRRAGLKIVNETFFDALTVDVSEQAAAIRERAGIERINLRIYSNGHIGMSLDETTTEAVVEAVWRVFGIRCSYADAAATASSGIPDILLRQSSYLTHPVFSRYRSETELLRYMRKLADRDLALDRAMIPLGSCTMKLNATAEMIPVTWPEFSGLHPFVPADQARGYGRLCDDLKRWLCDMTGYDAVSLQPNSGAQGEYAGLLAIRAYHRSRRETHRDVCLIPSSAHGTNPASAQMAGMRVVVVDCDAAGNVDVDDLREKAAHFSASLAAVMITYPSTHGVFEEAIREICDIIHSNGGQVYLDGANLNAQVGLCRPGDYGADVSHLNLHKTFCIPHGGGGPGMGPIGVKAHLAPFLPGHVVLDGGDASVGAIAAAPFGSAAILPISYAYILMMGAAGLTCATEHAILSANYIAARLEPYFPLLYKNKRGRVAHECIVDPRALKDATGVTAEDIAKRLIDYGFHAPTLSFPVAGTLMIEPTESESKAEIDRFINAMIAIRREIEDIENGRFSASESPLRHAPHTVHDLADDVWPRRYTRAEGCFPAGSSRADKYWSPVNRVDGVYGDRNVVCSCPPLSEYGLAAE